MHESTNQELGEIWNAVREDLRRSLPPAAFESWLEPLRVVGVRGGRLYVAGPERVREWFHKRYGSIAVAALRERLPTVTEIVFSEPDPGLHPGGVALASAELALQHQLSFDRFVIGAGNRFAHAAALAVAELPGEAYNPLFIHGAPGLGKTHLLVSIANYLRRQHPDRPVLYTTAERFTADFVGSLRGEVRRTEEFKRRHRSVAALLVDDVHYLQGKPKTEEELFHTFNELYATGSQLVLSSDRPPEAIADLSERLRDRFAWGLTVEVKGPDLATRVALLRRLVAERGVALPDPEVLRQIAVAAPANLRKLEGALTRVSAFASLLGKSPTPELVREALAPRSRQGEPTEPLPIGQSEPTLESIQRATCDVLRVSRGDLTSPRRSPNLVRARQLAMFVARRSTSSSLAEIARAFNRDHSTVLHSIRTVERRLEPGSDTHTALAAIHKRLDVAPRGA